MEIKSFFCEKIYVSLNNFETVPGKRLKEREKNGILKKRPEIGGVVL